MNRPLQNRVTPFGDLIATPARGILMGNRGRLHDPGRRVVRRIAAGYRAWVTCLLAFRGRHRAVMAPNRYTELFFLDEATALAAGHRPCGECRQADFRRFKTTWLVANRDRGLGPDVLIGAIDRELHRDRLEPDGRARSYLAEVDSAPRRGLRRPDGPRPGAARVARRPRSLVAGRIRNASALASRRAGQGPDAALHRGGDRGRLRARRASAPRRPDLPRRPSWA